MRAPQRLGICSLQAGFLSFDPELFRRFRQIVKSVPARTARASIPTKAFEALVLGAVADDMADAMKDPELHRTSDANWLKTDPFARSIVIRMALEPMRVKHTKLTSEVRRNHSDQRRVGLLRFSGHNGRQGSLLLHSVGRSCHKRDALAL